MKRSTRIAWIAAAVALYLLPLLPSWRGKSTGPAAGFAVARPVALEAKAAPAFQTEFLDPAFHTPSVHVASLCELAGGRLLAAWYGGTREGAQDVAIYLATREPAAAHWASAEPAVTRESAARELDRYVRKVGNAVVFSDGQQRVWLLYVSIADGGWCVPIYHELLGKFPELLWLPATGGARAVVKTRPFGGATAFQPALVPLSAQRALLVCRDFTSQHQAKLSRSEDAGASWTPPEGADLPNPRSGLDAIRLRDGRVLLAFNDTTDGRDVLGLAVSPDGGETWRRAGTLEREAGAEFSYPFLLETRDGLIHVAYTWKRKGIKQATFNLAWLDSQMERPVK